MTNADPVPIGTLPPLGEVPKTMYAQVIRPERFGDPRTAFKIEEVPVPPVGEHDVLVAVMASGINFNNVWAAWGKPIDVVAVRQRQGEPYDFHVGGSDASGIVYSVGSKVTGINVGDEVVTHPGWWNENDPWVAAGKDPMISPSARIYGYETNFGSFGQFSLVQSHQILPKAKQLSWEATAASTLVGTTAYRMLFGWSPNTVGPDTVVLVWGGSGGLGSQAIQLVREAGGIPIAVVSEAERGEYTKKLGAVGWIDRKKFDHWGVPPHWSDNDGQRDWMAGARKFRGAIWEIVGDRRDPAIVVEHPGEATIPTSLYVCEPGGMVAVCAGTSGYTAVADLRHHWVRQKRLQGSHGTNDEQAIAYNDLIRSGRITPSHTSTVRFEDIPQVHYEMGEGMNVFGNRVALVGAGDEGAGKS